MNDDILTLYYYNDGLTGAERRRVDNALAADPLLAERYKKLRQELGKLQDDETQALPADMMQRFHAGIDRAARAETGARRASEKPFNAWSFFWGAAVTTALAVGIGIGIWVSGTNFSDPASGNGMTVNELPSDATVPVAFTRSMQVHLRDSRQDLAGMSFKSDTERVLLILDLIEQNRLYEKAATQNNSHELARVLRAFEPILVRLAAEDIAPEDANALREQLAFELNVMLTKLARQSSNESHST